ncbi:MAG: hypothetical protein V7629_05920 [Motiliproteus sp.]
MSCRHGWVLFFLVILPGCSGLEINQSSQGAQQQFDRHHLSAAHQQEAEGHLSLALQHWQILATAGSNRRTATREISRLTQQMRTQAAPLIRSGKSALRGDNLKLAQRELLTALRIDPANREAFNLLRQASVREMQLRQRVKNAKPGQKRQLAEHHNYIIAGQGAQEPEMIQNAVAKILASQPDQRPATQLSESSKRRPVSIPEPTRDSAPNAVIQTPEPPADAQPQQKIKALYDQKRYLELIKSTTDWPPDRRPLSLNRWLEEAYQAQALLFKQKGDLDASWALLRQAAAQGITSNRLELLEESFREQMAQHYYDLGRKTLVTDIEQAIMFWKKALTYSADDAKVHLELKKAYRIRKNLRSIGMPN